MIRKYIKTCDVYCSLILTITWLRSKYIPKNLFICGGHSADHLQILWDFMTTDCQNQSHCQEKLLCWGDRSQVHIFSFRFPFCSILKGFFNQSIKLCYIKSKSTCLRNIPQVWLSKTLNSLWTFLINLTFTLEHWK